MNMFKEQWRQVLQNIVEDYRKTHPGDRRPTESLLIDLMDLFVSKGVVKKTPDGKYLLPRITGNLSPGYMEKVLSEIRTRQQSEGEGVQVNICHDDWCSLLADRGPCNPGRN